MNTRLSAFVLACALGAAPLAWGEPESSTLMGHEEAITSLAFSPDGKTIASASADQTIRLWSVDAGSVQRKLTGHEGKPITVCWSPDGRTIVSGADNGFLLVHDALKGRQLRSFNVNECVECVRFSPDGGNVAFGTKDNVVHIWDARTWTELRKIPCGGEVQAIEYSPDGTMLAAGDTSGVISIFEPGSGKRYRKCVGHTETVTQVAFSRDGKVLASSCVDNTVRLWDPQTGRTTRTLLGHSGYVHGVAISGDGKWIASVSEDNTVKVWDAASGEEVDEYAGHSGNVLAVAWSGKVLATGGKDKTVILWFMEAPKPKDPPKPVDPPKPDPPKPPEDNRPKTARKMVTDLNAALVAFEKDYGFLPHSYNSGMVAALTNVRKTPYYRFAAEELDERGRAIDPWGNPLVYRSPGRTNREGFDVYSWGPNRRDDDGRGDDIGNW